MADRILLDLSIMSPPTYSKLVEGKGRRALEEGRVLMVVPAFEDGTHYWLGVIQGTHRKHQPRVLVENKRVQRASCSCVAADHGHACYHVAAAIEVLIEAGEVEDPSEYPESD